MRGMRTSSARSARRSVSCSRCKRHEQPSQSQPAGQVPRSRTPSRHSRLRSQALSRPRPTPSPLPAPWRSTRCRVTTISTSLRPAPCLSSTRRCSSSIWTSSRPKSRRRGRSTQPVVSPCARRHRRHQSLHPPHREARSRARDHAASILPALLHCSGNRVLDKVEDLVEEGTLMPLWRLLRSARERGVWTSPPRSPCTFFSQCSTYKASGAAREWR